MDSVVSDPFTPLALPNGSFLFILIRDLRTNFKLYICNEVNSSNFLS